ncbi:hypothetical protein ACFC6Q_01400 [Enterococcus gallinarum]
MIGFDLPPNIYNYSYLGLSVILVIKICLDKFIYKNVLKYVVTAFVFILVAFYSKNLEVFLLGVLIIAAHNIKFESIIRTYAYTISTYLVFTIIFSILGFIESLVFVKRDTIRYALGTSYPTVLASFLFFLILCFVYLKRNEISKKFIIFIFIITFSINYFTDARSVAILLLVSAVSLLILNIFNISSFKINNVFSILLSAFSILIFLLNVYLSYNYKFDSRAYVNFDNIFSGRLSLGNQAFSLYDVNLFGQSLLSNGLGGGWRFNYGIDYFYIDALALDLLFGKGLIIFIFYLFEMAKLIFKSAKSKQIVLLIILLLISMYDFTDNKSFRIAFNPFILLMFNDYFSKSHEEVLYEK